MTDEIEAFLKECAPLRPTRDGDYTFQDRHVDFKTAFGSEAGKRVLRQIVDYCDGSILPDERNASQAELAVYVAKRKLGLWVLAVTAMPPSQS